MGVDPFHTKNSTLIQAPMSSILEVKMYTKELNPNKAGMVDAHCSELHVISGCLERGQVEAKTTFAYQL